METTPLTVQMVGSHPPGTLYSLRALMQAYAAQAVDTGASKRQVAMALKISAPFLDKLLKERRELEARWQ